MRQVYTKKLSGRAASRSDATRAKQYPAAGGKQRNYQTRENSPIKEPARHLRSDTVPKPRATSKAANRDRTGRQNLSRLRKRPTSPYDTTQTRAAKIRGPRVISTTRWALRKPNSKSIAHRMAPQERFRNKPIKGPDNPTSKA